MSFNEQIRQLPFLRLIIPFITGILIQLNFHLSDGLVIIISGIFSILVLSGFFIKKILQQYTFQWIQGIYLNLIIVIFGLSITAFRYNPPSELFKNLPNAEFTGYLTETPVEKTNSYKGTLQLEKYPYKILVYFEKNKPAKSLQMGDKLHFKGYINQIKERKNQYEFDYKTYLSYQGIFYQVYLKSDKWQLIGSGYGNKFLIFVDRIRERMVHILKNIGLTGDELGVASALTLGYRDEISDEITQAYASGGVSHILSVSGLHVGIIYLVIKLAFKFLLRIKSGRALWIFFNLISIWFYAFIAGLCPSILRAATMISFIVIGDSLKRPVSIYNSLSASAFLILLFDPFSLMNIGFQLSYLAILGIAYFYPKIHSIFYIKNRYLNKIWELIALSIAAQITTFPLTIYYFHMFPNYFILTNIVVIPLTGFIIYLAIAAFIVSWIPFVSLLTGKILFWGIHLLNGFILMIQKLPLSVTDNILFLKPEVIMMYILIFLLAIFLIYPKIFYLRSILVTVIFLLSFNVYLDYQINSQNECKIFKEKDEFVVSVITGKKCDLIYSSLPAGLKNRQVLKNYLTLAGIKTRNIKIFSLSEWKKQFSNKTEKNILSSISDKKRISKNY